jgi:hypothetical protein
MAGRVDVVGNQRLASYSAAAGILAGGLYTRDLAVLTEHVHHRVVGPAKLSAHHARLVQDGAVNVVAHTAYEWEAATEAHYRNARRGAPPDDHEPCVLAPDNVPDHVALL